MRIAAISDVHGNALAPDAILAARTAHGRGRPDIERALLTGRV